MFDLVLEYQQPLINLVITTVTRKPKKKSEMSPESYASKFAVEYLNNFQRDRDEIDPNASSCADNSRLTKFTNTCLWIIVLLLAPFYFDSTFFSVLVAQTRECKKELPSLSNQPRVGT